MLAQCVAAEFEHFCEEACCVSASTVAELSDCDVELVECERWNRVVCRVGCRCRCCGSVVVMSTVELAVKVGKDIGDGLAIGCCCARRGCHTDYQVLSMSVFLSGYVSQALLFLDHLF